MLVVMQKSRFTNKVLLSLIGANLLVFVFSLLLAGQYGLSESLYQLGAISAGLVLSGDVWRITTSAFLHADILHILFNLYAIWMLGKVVEDYFGTKKLVVVYGLSAILANVVSILAAVVLALNTNDASPLLVPSVGASGAVFGLLGVLTGNIIFGRNNYRLPLDSNQLLLIVGYNLLISILVPNINLWAHLGGLFTGVILSLYMKPEGFSGGRVSRVVLNSTFWVMAAILSATVIFQSVIFLRELV